MVFIRPTILRNAEDARFQTGQKYRYIQDLQRQMANSDVKLMKNEPQPSMPPLPPAPEYQGPSVTPESALPTEGQGEEPDGSQPQ
jgi:general secretion pathway protein D